MGKTQYATASLPNAQWASEQPANNRCATNHQKKKKKGESFVWRRLAALVDSLPVRPEEHTL